MAEFVSRFYDVVRCGYYPYAADSDPILGGFHFLLEELKEWSRGKTLEQTRLPLPTTALPTYLIGISNRGNCWIVVLWNEVPSSKGAVASASKSSPVGQPNIHENPIAPNSIPGFPTYFLCMPDQNLVATLRHGDRVAGLQGFKNYLSCFQELSTSIVVVGDDEEDAGDNEILGYMDEDGNILHLHPRLQLQLRRSGAQRDAILAKSARIRKVIRVKEMDPTNPSDLQLYQRGLIWLGLTARPPDEKVKFRQEVEIHPTRDELATIIDDLAEDVEARVNDVGFVLTGEASPYWLSGSIPTKTIEVETPAEEGVFSANRLAYAFNNREAAILAAANQ